MRKIKEKWKTSFSYHEYGIACLKIAWRLDRSVLPIGMLLSIAGVLQIYLGLFLSSEIIDTLLREQYQKGMVLAGILVGTNFLLGIGRARLAMAQKERNVKLSLSFKQMLREKVLKLDYESMEDAKKMGKLTNYELRARFQGDLSTLVTYYQEEFTAVLNVATSVVLVIILCCSAPNKGSQTLRFFSRVPVSLLLLVIVILGIGVILSSVMGKMNLEFQNMQEGHPRVEQKLMYVMEKVLAKYETAKVIRLFDMEPMIIRNLDSLDKENRNFFENMVNWYLRQKVLQGGTGSLFRIFSYLLVSIKVLAGAISVGAFARYAGALVQFGENVSQVLELEPKIRQISLDMKEILEFLQLPNLRETGSIPIEKRIDHEYELEFHDVSFCYPGTEEMILKHVSCKLKLKGKMAVVGENGAGKTTFIKLLCRLYDPTEGYITLNGVDIRKYDYDEYLSIFGVVFQDYSLFSFPIGENVAVGEAVAKEKAWNCLEKAGVKEVIQKMPKGLETPMYHYEEDGVELSGGEAQKVAIARALYKDAPFVILDEPTAALDPISEYEIYKRFDEMVEDKTSIYISHRMSSCRFCDDIMVFWQGQIVERGSHEQLLKANGNYAKLWNAQAQYYA